MQGVNIRDQFNLYSKKVSLFICLLLTAVVSCFSQEQVNYGGYKGVINLPNYDDKFLHYGFTIGINGTRFKIKNTQNYLANDSLNSVQSQLYPGFSLGFIVNARVSDNIDIRLLPTVAFYQRTIDFTFKNSSSQQTTESTFLELPMLVKYKSQRRKNSRMYVIGGIKPGIEAGAKKKDKKPSDLRTQNVDFAVDYGFGFDIYYELFKFSPEIRISHGFANMLNKDVNPYAPNIQRLSSHTVTLYLHFE